MKINQKILLLSSSLFFLLIIVSFLMWIPWLALLFLMLHSICLIYFTYLSNSSKASLYPPEELETLKQNLQKALNENRQLHLEIENLQKHLQHAKEESAINTDLTDSLQNKQKDDLTCLIPDIVKNEFLHSSLVCFPFNTCAV